MKQPRAPYHLPAKPEPDLTRVRAYWEGLKRGGNEIPFWDDVKLSALPKHSARMASIDVFEKPLRFRFGIVGRELRKRYGKSLEGKFADDIGRGDPFDYLGSQCHATVESGTPTYYRHEPGTKAGRKSGYARLLLPLWGDGHISMLLCAAAW